MASGRLLFRSEELGPGVTLHHHRTRAFKTVTARLAFQADLDEGTAARALVCRVLARGTRRLPSLRDLQIELDRNFGAGLSGDTRKVGERQIVQFSADWVLDRLAGEPLFDRMGTLLAEYVADPALDADGGLREEIVLQERKNLADEALAVFDDKARYARYRLLEVMCRDEAYARPSIGRLDEIRSVTRADVQGAWRDMLERAPVDLFLVGDLPLSRAVRFARRLGLHEGRRPRRLRRTTRRRPERVRTVRERQDVGQAKLAMGFRTSVRPDGPLYPAMVILNALYGGSPVGKLFKQVREKASLCYAIHSSVERTKGLLTVHAGIDADKYARARRLILAQLDALRRGAITAEEAAMARSTLRSALRALRDSPHGIIDFALERAVHGLPADLDGLLRRLDAVTLADVSRAARTVQLDTVYLLRQ